MKDQRYIPALAYRPLNRIYDPLVRLTTRESVFKSALLRQACLLPGAQVLDLGCGTATLSIGAKQLQPHAEVTGVDGDPDILRRARAKAVRAGSTLRLDEALSHHLPYPDATFDCVLSSLFFHHLNRDHKCATLVEVHRVLRPGGMLHVADWGRPANALMRGLAFSVQWLDGFENTADNVSGRLPELMCACGFSGASETARYSTLFGTLSLYRATRAGTL